MPPERNVRLAVVGAGLIGRAHIERIRGCPGAALSAIADPHEGAGDLAASLGVPWFATLDELIAADLSDGVVLATPNRLHVPGALACIRAGLPVLVEKPVSDDVSEAVRLADASAEAGIPVLVGHHRRHSPLIERSRAIVRSGRLGQVTAVSGLCWLGKPASYFEAASWRREPGGGVVLINLVHVIDDLRNLCGDVVSVQAVTSNAVRNFPVEDTAAIILRFASGALGTLSCSDAVAAPWSWELTAGENKAYPRTDQFCYLVGGTEGSLSVPRLEIWRHTDERAWFGPIEAERIVSPDEDPLTRQIAHFRDVVRGESAPVIDAREGARTLATTLAVLEAARTGASVAVPTL